MRPRDMRRWRYYCTPWWSFLLLSHTCIALVADSNFSATGSSKLRQYWFDTIIDHFNFRRPASSNGSFPLRYFVSEEFLGKQPSSSPPCFFYAGNEADITTFIKNSGFLFEAAKEMRALIVFAEHRYYGQSYPFGGASTALTPQNISYLTVEQAMADFNNLNVHIREKWNLSPASAFVVFGGSYGGNLAMWLRLKNPNLWAGAIASSATPLKHLLRDTNAFNRIVAEVYANVSSSCPGLVRAGWKQLYRNAKTELGRKQIAREMNLCRPFQSARGADFLHGFVSDALETMVQYGYPYETEFYNPVPAYPFRAACKRMLKYGTPLGALRAAAEVYYNHTGQRGGCFDFDSIVVGAAGRYWARTGQHYLRGMVEKQESGNPTDSAWGYQTCTEVYQPMPTDGETDMEVPYKPNATEYFHNCMHRWGVVPRPDWEEITFGGADIAAGSNIFLSSGELDPWRAAGIQTKPRGAPESIIVRIIEGGAHHLDLRQSNPKDPSSVVDIRVEEMRAIQKWIAEWKITHPDGVVGPWSRVFAVAQ